MPTFSFRYETVLRQRQAVEDMCQRGLAKLLRERMILQTQLRTMQQTISSSKRDLAEGLAGKVDLDQISGFARYSGQVTHRGREIVARMSSLEKQIDEERRKLLDAMRARKALDLLRQRAFDQWRRDEQRREEAQLDELATQQFLRHGAAGVSA